MIHKNQKFIQYCQMALEDFVSKTNGIHLVSLSSIDGFEIATQFVETKEISAMRLSAMGSSLLALSSGVTNEFQLDQINFLEINTNSGHVFIASALIADQTIVVLIQTDSKTLQGELVYQGKNLIKKITMYNTIYLDLT